MQKIRSLVLSATLLAGIAAGTVLTMSQPALVLAFVAPHAQI
jgi:hypothetical protein